MRAPAVIVFAFALAAGAGQAASVDEGFFGEKLYPAFREAQCHMCHNDNGVASGTRFEFPPDDASAEQVRAFGLRLASVVHRDEPKASLLYLKPTNRAKHAGGERIKQGSAEEELLLTWVDHLVGLSDEQLAAGREAAVASSGPEHGLTMRRLTHAQYNNAVRDLVGELSRPADSFPPEGFIHGFKNQAHGQSTSPLLVEAYSAAAEKLAANAFRGGDQNNLIPCEPDGAGDVDCLERFVRSFGRRAFRRPLGDSEAERYAGLAAMIAQDRDDFLAGAAVVVEAMLQSPRFLMRAEEGGGPWQAYENASKLSFFLWNTIPDDWLLDVAERGELVTAEQIEQVARKMLDDPRAQPAMDEFLAQWMRFDRALETIRDRRQYGSFTPETAAAMVEETRRFFRHLVWNDEDFMGFFTAGYVFPDAQLAEIYGVPAPAEPFSRVDLPADSPRAGVLGQGTFLTLTSKPADSSPTARGLFIREHFLCQAVPPPPPGVNAALPPLTDAKPMTNRERLAVHLSNEACASCHRLIDPIGYGFEHFDAIGRYRATHDVKIPPTRDEQKRKLKTETTEYQLEIDSSAEVVGIAGSGFSSPKELGQVLAKDEGCQKCVVKQLFRYALGRPETLADRRAIDGALEAFRDSRYRFRELIISIVTSEPFLGGGS